MEILTFQLSDEHVDLLCNKFGYTPIINVNTGESVDGKEIKLEKPITKADFLYNYYAGIIDSDAVIQKHREVTESALAAIPSIILDAPQEAKLPELSAEEIADAVKEATLIENKIQQIK